MSFAAINPSSNIAIGSSRKPRSAGPLLIQFGPDWRDNEIMDWYGPRPTKISTLQLRREKSEPWKHQYVVLILTDDSILRLDRRGDENKPVDTMTRAGTESKDTIANVNSLSDLDKTSYCLAELHCLGSDVDLSSIIKICFGIHIDDKAGRYTLQRFNCYFFAWTIFVLWRAVSRRARLAWAMPQWLIRFALRLMIRRWWRTRMHTSLRHKLRESLLSALQPTLRSALADLQASTLRNVLWKDDVGDAMRISTRRDVMASLVDAGTNALSKIRVTMEDVDAFHSLAVTFADRDLFGARTGDWRAAFIALVDAFMQAAPRFAAQGAHGFVEDDKKWDEVWNSIRDNIREAVEKEWVAGWEVIRPKMRDAAQRAVNEMTDLVSNALAYSVVETLPDTPLHIGVRDMVPSRLRRGSDAKFIAGLAHRTHSETQPYMLKLIQEHGRVASRYPFGSPSTVGKDIREAMDRVWKVVADLDGGGANANDGPTADVS
ncbi:hypothetical protein BS47DRAFT_1367043 [Hydnum rufescens UP504]|uniref:Uncharacterized protein n=1 Tax=Hydnum rufescens UP504 TaxID=1448309 RepID=A0A9P6AK83_9AGAM|nr:hypothetical protein BS47DRAFT_1367043 [Hydnum rufescens UP504]